MIFDEYLWIYIKTFLFDPRDIQRRIRHNKDEIRTQHIFKNYYLITKFDIYDAIMSEVSEDLDS
jgi:hypothetical protein